MFVSLALKCFNCWKNFKPRVNSSRKSLVLQIYIFYTFYILSPCWQPHVRTWGLLEAHVLYWRKYLWPFWAFSATHALIPRPHGDSALVELFLLSLSNYVPAPCIHKLQRCINTAPLPKALTWACYASTTKHYDKTVILWHAITRGSDIVTEQERSLAIYTSPRLSHAIRNYESVPTAAFQARRY